mmetsp:Transcript_12940/g.36686  ORF Transcript_12940/g.36686 Transcript_12940/m.36686 type:complete len:283 (+) Transcript_12940:383-1231(+)
MHSRRRSELDRVPQRRAVRRALQAYDLVGHQAGDPMGVAQQGRLSQPVRRGQRSALAVLVHRAPGDQRRALPRVPRVAVPPQHQAAVRFASAVAVGGGVEGRGPPAARQHLHGAPVEKGVPRPHVADPQRESDRASTFGDIAHRGAGGHQRGGARRVDGQAGALQAEHERHPVGEHLRAVGHRQRIVLRHQRQPVVGHDPHVDGRLHLGQRLAVDVRVLECVGPRLQALALLRVHALDLGLVQAEELVVELLHVVEEGAVLGVDLVTTGGVRVVDLLVVPAE